MESKDIAILIAFIVGFAFGVSINQGYTKSLEIQLEEK